MFKLYAMEPGLADVLSLMHHCGAKGLIKFSILRIARPKDTDLQLKILHAEMVTSLYVTLLALLIKYSEVSFIALFLFPCSAYILCWYMHCI
jgi:hypothetical protein